MSLFGRCRLFSQLADVFSVLLFFAGGRDEAGGGGFKIISLILSSQWLGGAKTEIPEKNHLTTRRTGLVSRDQS